MRKQEFDFEKRPTERPDPVHYLRKREGSPGGLKPPTAGSSLQLATGLIPAQRGSPQSASGSPASGKPRPTLFRKKYDRGELPVRVDQDRPGRNGLRWTADLAAIDLHLYLPIFVEGLQETQEPFRMLARQGVEDLITRSPPERLLPVIPQLIMGLRGALKSPDADVIQAGLHALNLLVRTSEGAGLALAPYCRQLLPPLARYVDNKSNIGELVLNCLHALEKSGGPDAFMTLKYFLPTYESALRPSRVARKA